MTDHTTIAWTDATWNPVVGCDRVSPGCAHCYAKTLHDKRHRAFREGKLQALPQYAHPFETVQTLPERLEQPLRWRRPRRIFVNSLSDLFHDDVPDDFIAAVWASMALAPRHTFQILTKRAERMQAVLGDAHFYPRLLRAADLLRARRPELTGISIADPAYRPLPNVWLGVSIENRRHAGRAALLAGIPAAVRFVSAEPLLGPLDLTELHPSRRPDYHGARDIVPLQWLHWVIVGGESGPDHRPMDLAWAESLRRQCAGHGAFFFFKQRSGARAGLTDGVPPELLVREWPNRPAASAAP